MTYGELKLASLQKMFHDIKTLEENEVTKPYLDKMPYVTNCAITRACTVGEAIKKSVTVKRLYHPNMIENYKKYHKNTALIRESVVLKASSGKSLCVTVCGKGTLTVLDENELNFYTCTFDNSEPIEYKTKITNPNNGKVTVVIRGQENFFFSYPAVYDAEFSNSNDIPSYGKNIYYDITKLADDFYRFDSSRSIIQDCEKEGVFYEFTDEKTVSIDGEAYGVWKIPYLAYPSVITEDTSDDTEINLPYELCVILPFYIASELYLEDDSGLSIGWRNKFESSLSEYAVLKRMSAKRKYEVVESAGGYYGRI